MQRVVITGLGICSAVGNSVPEVLNSLRQARSGLKPYRCAEAPNLHTRYAGTDDDFAPESSFAKSYIDRWDRGTLLAAHAASEALTHSQLPKSVIHSARMGLATGASGSGQFQPTKSNPFAGARIPYLAAKIIHSHNTPYFQTNELGRYFQIHGPLVSACSASAGSGVAITIAMRWIQHGLVDCALAGGGEGLLPLNIIGFDLLGLLSRDPCSPFSRSEGMSMGEGAGFVVLESFESATRRGAPILAELFGSGITSDAFDAIQFDPSGDGIRRALKQALNDGELRPQDIDWIRASGAGGSSQDASELAAIKSAFGNHYPVICSLEPTFGHTNGAGPAMGLVAGVACQNANLIPATLNFDTAKQREAYDFVPNVPWSTSTQAFASTTAAFGGTNIVLVAGKPKVQHVPHASNDDAVVISGIGLVSPVGCGRRELLPRLMDGPSGITAIDRWENVHSNIRHAGFVQGFDARKILPSLRLRGADLLTQYAAAAVKLAIEDSDLRVQRDSDGEIGLACAISRTSGDTLSKLFDSLEGAWDTLAVSKALLRKGRFLIASQLANWFGFKSFNATISDGLGCGYSALAAAWHQLRSQPELNAVMVLAADELSHSSVRLSESLRMAATDGEPMAPYESDSAGMVHGEGAVALVLERASHAQARGARPMAMISSLVQTFDAIPLQHCSENEPWLQQEASGEWLAHAIEKALENSQCPLSDISSVFGNGCGVPAYDARELKAIRRVLPDVQQVQTVNRQTGVLESACGLLAIASACQVLETSTSRKRSSATSSGNASVAEQHPASALIVGSSDAGRNTAIVVSSFDS